MALSLSAGAINLSFAVLFYALATLSGVFLSLSALLLEDVSFRTYARGRDYARLIAYSVARTSAIASS